MCGRLFQQPYEKNVGSLTTVCIWQMRKLGIRKTKQLSLGHSAREVVPWGIVLKSGSRAHACRPRGTQGLCRRGLRHSLPASGPSFLFHLLSRVGRKVHSRLNAGVKWEAFFFPSVLFRKCEPSLFSKVVGKEGSFWGRCWEEKQEGALASSADLSDDSKKSSPKVLSHENGNRGI